MDAIAFLETEHQKAKAALGRVVSAAADERGPLWDEVELELVVHEEVEDACLYTPLMDDPSAREHKLIEWRQRHQDEVDAVEDLIGEIDDLDPKRRALADQGEGRAVERETPRTQEFALAWSSDGGRLFHEILRQQWTFSPPGTTREVEDYTVDLDRLTVLERAIIADRRGATPEPRSRSGKSVDRRLRVPRRASYRSRVQGLSACSASRRRSVRGGVNRPQYSPLITAHCHHLGLGGPYAPTRLIERGATARVRRAHHRHSDPG